MLPRCGGANLSQPLISHFGTAGPLPDFENDEFSRLDRGNADHHDEPAIIEICLRHRRSIVFDKESLLRLLSLETTVFPQSRQNVADAVAHSHPQNFIVGFKDHPARALLRGGFHEDDQTADIHIPSAVQLAPGLT